MLLILGSLPASGKSTISKWVAHALSAAYMRVDTIEQTLRDAGLNKVHNEGYELAYKIAADNLSLGFSVVADSVNCIGVTCNVASQTHSSSYCQLLISYYLIMAWFLGHHIRLVMTRLQINRERNIRGTL